ncbi:AAA family ATPase [Shewanella acanthi]|uniref:AAA family ATPase n=1 Tax=Shewanella acanthi TaxID=2864212 RepID=UPI0021ABC151|nr:AAA family ATPase [Shewanella acanthi]
MENKLILRLAEAALSGDKNLGQMAVRQFSSRIRATNANLYELLINKLEINATRSLNLNNKPLPVDVDTRQSLIKIENPVSLDKAPVHAFNVGEALEQILLERKYINELLSEGIFPARSVIFQGEPGVGKTMTARWLAKNLGLPLLTLDLATVMSSFLGKTGSNVRAVLDHAMSTPCVLLLDEFDAIAKRRDDDRELGELKRLVTVLLQAIDDWPYSSLLIAATNHGELLDPAIWRRFDIEITFPMPSVEVINKYLIEYWPDAIKEGKTAEQFSEMSFSNIDRELRKAKREKILSSFSINSDDAFLINYDTLLNHEINAATKEERNMWIIKLHKQGKSQRAISEALGVSRPTIKKILDEQLKK